MAENGEEINYQENRKNRGYDGYVFAAPVTPDGETVYVGAVVKKTSKNRLYLHEVVDSDGNIIEINDGDRANQTGLAAKSDAGTQSPSFEAGIAQTFESVNRKKHFQPQNPV